MRKYIHVAKAITPALTRPASDLIAEEYAKLRSQDSLQQDNLARVLRFSFLFTHLFIYILYYIILYYIILYYIILYYIILYYIILYYIIYCIILYFILL